MRFGYPVQAQHRKYRIVRSGRDTNRQKTRIFVHQHIHMRACTRHACPDREGGEPCSDRPNPSKGQGQQAGDRLQVGQLAVEAAISRCILHLTCASKAQCRGTGFAPIPCVSVLGRPRAILRRIHLAARRQSIRLQGDAHGTAKVRRDGMRCDLRESGVIM